MTFRTRARLAVLKAGPGAALSASASVWWQGLGALPATMTVTVPRNSHARQLQGVRLRYRALDDAEVIVRSGLRVTSLPLSLLEAAIEDSITVVDNALLRRRVSVKQLTEAAARRTGTPDERPMADILELLGPGARSAAERIAVSLLHADDVAGWTANHATDGYVADLAFLSQRLIVEIDGFAYHRDAAAFQRDRERRNDLTAAGWTVLNFTWADLTERPDQFVARIRRALAAAA
ncbi:DUF559 domain-containing protein [Gordonia amicalis]|nr:DUF559 domain-containing protein [Gordonia amicalis]MDV7101314.1 DUF559 domain-containing protein [Gordonia amicalis]